MSHDEHRTIDFFTEDALPAPRVTQADAERIAAQHLGFDAHAEALGSQQDANFLLRDENGADLAVLKIANPAFGAVEIEAQDAAADLVSSAHPELRVATVLRRPDGSPRRTAVDTESGPADARLLRHLPGGTLSGPRHLSPSTVAAMGTIAAKSAPRCGTSGTRASIVYSNGTCSTPTASSPSSPGTSASPSGALPSAPRPPKRGHASSRLPMYCRPRPCTWTSPTTI
ncbi:hypothetical protein ACFQ0Q_46435 [Streptomyces aureus]